MRVWHQVYIAIQFLCATKYYKYNSILIFILRFYFSEVNFILRTFLPFGVLVNYTRLTRNCLKLITFLKSTFDSPKARSSVICNSEDATKQLETNQQHSAHKNVWSHSAQNGRHKTVSTHGGVNVLRKSLPCRRVELLFIRNPKTFKGIRFSL